ncbi:SDR family oxidoreductase [uncultured Sphingobium sp.]|uniref:SDR family NAD(P)-dependent oxidoreductase n=1 Tax=uncultured Sphingobium sp. TaxID=316087 RepID=UPI00259BE02B|nr:SDR family oxidoreductase [uncultured Sphingobium sp.]
MISLQGKVAVVTGGASGIGAATVKMMIDLGAQVVIADVDEESSAALEKALGHTGNIAACRTDILIEDDIRGMIDFAVDRFGGLDILHNNAGIPRTIAPDAEVTGLTVEMWNKTIAGHVTSAMLGCKYAIPKMIARGGGAIVNTSSSSALAATVDLVAYGVAKSGLHALTREVAATYGRDNIRCNAVVPGAVMTERGRKTLPPDIFQLFATETPLPRLAEPEDIASVAVFLASDAAGMVTGQALTVDGGMMTKLPYWLPKMRASRGTAFDESTYGYEAPD